MVSVPDDPKVSRPVFPVEEPNSLRVLEPARCDQRGKEFIRMMRLTVLATAGGGGVGVVHPAAARGLVTVGVRGFVAVFATSCGRFIAVTARHVIVLVAATGRTELGIVVVVVVGV